MSKTMRKQLDVKYENNIQYIAKTTPIYKWIISDKAISTVTGEVDAKNQEEAYVKIKIPEH